MSLKEKLTTYNPDEFMPIFVDGELDNKSEFALYKAEQISKDVGRATVKTFRLMATVARVVADQAVKNYDDYERED